MLLIGFSDVINDATECRLMTYDELKIESCKTALHHTAPKQLNIFFQDNTPDFISSQEWTPHSPDLNLLHYSVWDIL